MRNTQGITNKWLNFLYGFFIVQCFLLPISLFRNIITLVSYKRTYGTLSGVKGVFYFALLVELIRIIIKIIAVKNKYTQNGYGVFIASLFIDAFDTIVNGFSQNSSVGVISLFLSVIIFIPNFIYVKNRKILFDGYLAEWIICKCAICNQKRPSTGKCPICGSRKKTYSVVYPSTETAQTSSSALQTVTEEAINDNISQNNKKENTVSSKKDAPSEIAVKTTTPVLYCRKCGGKIPSDSIFCNKCGTKVITEVNNNEMQ